MSFRVRVFLALAAVGLIPLALLLVGIRREVTRRLTAQFEENGRALAAVIHADFAREGDLVGARLRALVQDVETDNRFRLAFRGLAPDRRYLIDYAETAMRRGGLAYLLIQAPDGRILSSGHFRNEYDRVDSLLPARVAAVDRGVALVRGAAPDTALVVLARLDSASVAGERVTVIGGVRPGGIGGGQASVRWPGPAADGPVADSLVSRLPVTFIDAAVVPVRVDTAHIVVVQSLEPLRRLTGSLDLWFAVVSLGTAGVALLAAGWVSGQVTNPLRELAGQTARVDLDRLDGVFESERDDEIGSLSRLLGEMVRRLRAGAATLREAERRATVGDLARQLNHDVKNGLIPIRNVFRHLSQVARETPDRLPAVLLERQPTLDAAIGYLETLAQNYARLSPAFDRQPCDLNAVVEDTLRDLGDAGGVVRRELGPGLPRVAADPVVLRRILDNLVRNAVDSLERAGAGVTVSTVNGGAGAGVRLTVADSGRGMTQAELGRAFDDFYTTKAGGTGLGLSIVKRLVLDLHGTLRVETAPGAGTRFIIDLPAVT